MREGRVTFEYRKSGNGHVLHGMDTKTKKRTKSRRRIKAGEQEKTDVPLAGSQFRRPSIHTSIQGISFLHLLVVATLVFW